MAVIYDKETDMTDLQRRVTAELKQREVCTSSDGAGAGDHEHNSEEANKMERLPGWVWLVAVGIVAVIGLFIAVSR